MAGGEGDCCVVVVGAGAAGALTASHLVTGLSSRYRVVLVDPAPTTGRGTAYSTRDDRHLLNVPASGMSAFPRDPEHFFRWVRRHHDAEAKPQDFVPRYVYGSYLESLLETAAEFPGNARLERKEHEVAGHREARRPVRRTTLELRGDRRPRRGAGHRHPAEHRLGPRRPRQPPRRRPVERGPARGRPPAGRHRADHGRRRDRRRPARPGAAHGLAPRPAPPRPPPAHDAGGSPSPGRHPHRDSCRSCARSSTSTWRTPSPRPATGARPSTASGRSPPSSGAGSATRTSAPSSPTTPAPGTCTGTGCRRPRPSGWPPSSTPGG